MILSLSTGSVRRSADSILQQIHLIENRFGGLVDGIEFCFIFWRDFEEFELDEKASGFLKKLKFNTLHAPIKGIEYGENKQTRAVLQKIKEINEVIKLQQITFHPNHVKKFSVLWKVGVNACIENLPDGETKKGWQFPRELQEFFKTQPWLGLCFDVNHGMANGAQPSEFISVLGKKISYVHLNATERAGKAQHNLLIESSPAVREKIKPIFGLGKPIVIEVDVEKGQIPLLEKEIAFIRESTKNIVSMQ